MQPIRSTLRFLIMTPLFVFAWGLVFLSFSAQAPAQNPAPTPAAPPPAAAPVAPNPNAPKLTHDERMKFFDWDDQKREILDKLQKQYLAETAPIDKAEDEYKRKLETQTPGWMLRPGPQGWEWTEVPKQPAAESPKKNEKK